MDILLETCFMHFHGCNYQVSFNDYVLGKSKLSSGNCPNCPRETVILCPGCQRPMLTSHYIANNLVCSDCDAKLPNLCKQRKIWLSDLELLDKVRRSNMPLEPRQKAVLKLTAEGRSNKEIADLLEMSIRTVETFRARIMQQVQAHSVIEVMEYAIVYGMVNLNEIHARVFAKRC